MVERIRRGIQMVELGALLLPSEGLWPDGRLLDDAGNDGADGDDANDEL